MTPLSPFEAHWPAISALLDEALSLSAPERASWLASLAGERAAHREVLRTLLANQAQIETDDFLNELPQLDTGDAVPSPGGLTTGSRIGAYRLIAEIGQGGMGTVWLAERADGLMNRRVALKLPRIVWGDSFAERLAREREILATLEHEHIARLYDAGIDAHGRPFLAMEYVDGQPIDAYCRAHALPMRERVALLLQVMAAVSHAHARLVVHRDLKPSNILVTRDAKVKLLDFGIAKLLEGDSTLRTALTELSGRALTLDYASPEQIRGEPLGTASDVYSLAVVAYGVLADARPYRLKRGTAAEMEEAIASAEPLRASDAATDPALGKQLRGDLDAILGKAMKKDVAQRYATVEAFGQDLQRHLDRQPVLAQPDRPAYRLRKFCARHTLLLSASGVAMLALLGGVGAVAWQGQIAAQQARRAEQVSAFVVSIFTDADRDSVKGRSMTALDLLAQAQARLDAQPVQDPATTVELLTAMGISLLGLGEHSQALKVLGQASSLAAAQLEPFHPSRAAVELARGETLAMTRELDAAWAALTVARQGMQRSDNAIGQVHAMALMSSILAQRGKFDDALSLSAEALQLAQARIDSPPKNELMNAYATRWEILSVAGRTGRLDPARRGYEVAREVYGDRMNSALISMKVRYASTLADEADAAAGAREIDAALKQQIVLLGPDHPEVAFTQLVAGHTAVTAGDPQGAIGHYQEAVRIWSSLHRNPQDSDVASARAGLAAAMIKARRFDDALSELHQIEQAFPAGQPPNRFWRAAQRSIALLLLKRGRIDEAAARIDLLVAAVGNASADPAIELVVGQLRSAQGRHAEALQHLRVAAAAYEARPNRSVQAVALSALGAAELAAGETAASLATLQRADKLFEESQTIVSPDHAELWMALARAQLATGSPEAAARNADRAEHYWMGFGSNQAAIAQARSIRQSAASQQPAGAATEAQHE